MTAHTAVRDYGASVATVCEECGLDEAHDRYRDALTAAATHNHDQHPRPEADQDGMGLA